MTKDEDLKKRIKDEELDRREIAKKIGVKPGYLNQMLNGWAPLKEEYGKAIEKMLDDK